MALITSDSDAMRLHEHQIALITSDCVLFRPGDPKLLGFLAEDGSADAADATPPAAAAAEPAAAAPDPATAAAVEVAAPEPAARAPSAVCTAVAVRYTCVKKTQLRAGESFEPGGCTDSVAISVAAC